MVSYTKGSIWTFLFMHVFGALLRDRPFTIRTDHRNLLFIKQSSNRMIVRWYMALSEFTFNI